MKEIKEQFRDWLINQRLADETKSGRPGTVYEYLKSIETEWQSHIVQAENEFCINLKMSS